jgi:hypothetical protein
MLPFRVVVIDEHRTTTTVIVSLERSPDVGATIELPHGDRVTVRHVVSGQDDDVAGIVIAAPAEASSGSRATRRPSTRQASARPTSATRSLRRTRGSR